MPNTISAVRLGVGDGQISSSLTTPYILASPIPAGRRAIVSFCSNNSNTDGAIVCTDTRGNVYVVDQDHQIATRRVIVFSGLITTPLQAGDTITVTALVAATRRCIDVVAGTNIGPKEQTVAGTNANSSTPNSGASAARTTANSLLFGACGWANSVAGDTFTVGVAAAYGNGNSIESFTGAVARHLGTEWAIVSATGTEAADGTLPGLRNWSMLLVTYPELANGGLVAGGAEAEITEVARCARVS